MKKILSVVLALVLLLLCTVVCSAEDQSMTISTVGEVAYEISYPADIQIPWKINFMGIGFVTAVLLNIEPSKVVEVSVSSAYDYNLAHDDDASKTIAYQLYGAENIRFLPGSLVRTYGLFVRIEDSQWEQADPGQHSDLLTFTAEYVDA